MLILALESSAKPASTALYKNENGHTAGMLLGQYYQNNGFSHSRTLMAMVDALLCNLGLKPFDLDLIAVANGPGSFTGVRIGVSAAKGLAFGLDIPICAVSTLKAMAYQTGNAHNELNCSTIICPVMNARHGQVYNALFQWAGRTLIRLREDRIISIDDLFFDLKNFGTQIMPVGDGSDLILPMLNDSSVFNPVLSCPLTKNQTAFGVAFAALHEEPICHVQLEPVYLRPSQAERERFASGESV